jgi:hypothetical protein
MNVDINKFTKISVGGDAVLTSQNNLQYGPNLIILFRRAGISVYSIIVVHICSCDLGLELNNLQHFSRSTLTASSTKVKMALLLSQTAVLISHL